MYICQKTTLRKKYRIKSAGTGRLLGNVVRTMPDNGTLVEEIAEERADIKVCKLDVDQEPELARQYRVMSIPTFLVFKEGEVVKRDMGVMSKEEVEGLVG